MNPDLRLARSLLPRLGRLFALCLAMALAALLALPAPRPASANPIPSTITITKTAIENDDGNGCSLYEALQAIFVNQPYHQCPAGSDINLIVFSGAAAGGTITFPAKPNDLDLPMINKNVAITGPVTINGNGANTDQHIFRIAPGGTLSLANMVIKNAHTSGGGGAILDLNYGTVNILGVSFEGNVAEGDGGAINSNGTLNILSSNFVANQAQGIMPDKSNNPATGYGGAINMTGSDKLKLALTNFSGNLADKGGGALYHSSAGGEVSDVIFSGNIVKGTGSNNTAAKGGGAIYNDADTPITIIRSAFNGNLTPTSSGGAIYSAINSTNVISDTSFNGNLAGTPGSAGSGGAIYNVGGDLSVTRATFLNNAAIGGDGGAIANDRRGNATVANSSFTANAAADGNGGAIDNTNTQLGGPASSVLAKNVTFSANAAINSSGHGGAVFNAQGHSFTLGNSIVDGSVADNCTGTITSLGHNLDSANTCAFNQAGDKPNANANLDTPAFNGGPIVSLLTQKLLAGSDAIDTGDPAICSAQPVGNVDQRGDPRPKGAACDIGSFESDPLVPGYGSTPVQPGPIVFGNATANGVDTVDTTFSIYETGNATLTVSNPQFGGANPGDFSVKAPSPFPLSIQDGFPERAVTLTCKPGAVGQRSATLTLTTNDPAHQQVTYNLACNGTSVPAPSFASDPLAPGPIDFGEALIGATANFSLAISNTGDADLHITGQALGGANPADFKLPASPPAPIAPNTLQNVQLQCKPTDLGIRTATLTYSTDDPNRPTVAYTLACAGVPVPPPILTPGTPVPTQQSLTGAYGVAVSPDDQFVYVTGLTNGAITIFRRNATTGDLAFSASISTPDLAGARLLAITPDGKNAYAAGSQAAPRAGQQPGAIVAFSRDTTTGMLSTLDSVKDGDTYLCGFSPIKFCPVKSFAAAYGVAASPDSRYVYLTSPGDNGVAVLFRDQADGGLKSTFGVNRVQEITSTVDLAGARGVALSPDGANLYVTGYSTGNAATGQIAVYKRNANNGQLTHVQTLGECDNPINCFIYYMDGLGGAYQVAVSPDGQFVYAIGTYDGSVVVFRRDALDGSLTHVKTYKQGVGGIDGLTGVSGVTVSPDGKYLYTASFGNSPAQVAAAVVVFGRDPASGLLETAQVIRRTPASGAGGVPALDGGRDIRTSADGSSVYAAAFRDNTVVPFHTANPAPVAQSLAPASAQSGGAGFTLTIDGAGFMPGSQVEWNGTNRPTSFVNNTRLTAQIAAADIAAAGSADVSVVNPAPGGGVSNALQFTITAPGQNPVPSITTLAPASAPAGGAAFTLTVNGANFMAGSQVKWNGANRPTTFVSSTQLTAQIAKADIAQPGPVGVTVVNPGPGGGASNAVAFDINAPGENPTPSIASVSPSQVMADVASAQSISVLITGANFIVDSQAQWNGANRPTTFVSSTQLRIVVTAADIAVGGKASLTVVNPGPGGGTSNTATFTIIPLRVRTYLPSIRR